MHAKCYWLLLSVVVTFCEVQPLLNPQQQQKGTDRKASCSSKASHEKP